ncbi:OLC1v1039266C1 [Oldenlandia corymbosa var. corymbosa]|uniref:OLC1v1039266C1 n=1 Tax=Oldenlandia corymbosa var. corymbosa TaxID=529605 RepID=A0AAV1D1R6_OLDCO|nr:OLC1v1039266C1 [Oldenlandia corymbosa var. corymbosa]
MASDDEGSVRSEEDDDFNEDFEALRRACLLTGTTPSDLQIQSVSTSAAAANAWDATSNTRFNSDDDDDHDGYEDLLLVRDIQRRFAIVTDNREPLTLEPLSSMLPGSNGGVDHSYNIVNYGSCNNVAAGAEDGLLQDSSFGDATKLPVKVQSLIPRSRPQCCMALLNQVSKFKETVERSPAFIGRARWSKEESEKLTHGSRQQFQEMLLQRSLDLLSEGEGGGKGSGVFDGILVSIGEVDFTPEKMRLFFPKARYQRSLNASIIKREWTEEEDNQLRAAVEAFGEGNWQFVASAIEGRTGTQCSNRRMKTLHPTRQRVGRWTKDEDKHLKVAVMLFGPKNWRKIGLPDPTDQEMEELVEEKEARRTLDLLEIRRGERPVPNEGEERARKEIPYREASRAELFDALGDTFWEALEKTNPVVYQAIQQFAQEHLQKKQSRRQDRQRSPSFEELSKRDWEPSRGNVQSRLGPKAPPEKSRHDYHRGGDPPP